MQTNRELYIKECEESIAHYKQRKVDLPQFAKYMDGYIATIEADIENVKNGGDFE